MSEKHQNVIDKTKEVKVKIQELNTEFQDKSKKLLAELAGAIFDTFPELNSFGWTQGTAYDDEGYSFRTRIDPEVLLINGKSYDEDDDCKVWSLKHKLRGISDPLEELKLREELKIAEAKEEAALEVPICIYNALEAFEQEDLETMFGDHFKITVNRGGTVDLEQLDYFE